jgi:hypothetical protein
MSFSRGGVSWHGFADSFNTLSAAFRPPELGGSHAIIAAALVKLAGAWTNYEHETLSSFR